MRPLVHHPNAAREEPAVVRSVPAALLRVGVVQFRRLDPQEARLQRVEALVDARDETVARGR